MNLTVQEMLMFTAVVECKSLTKAADKLNLATPGISRSLKKLEEKLGCSLLQRTTRSISLTQEGEWLFNQAHEIINNMSAIEHYFLEDDQIPRGIVRVDAATPFTLHGIAPLISGFNKCYPDITVVLESSESVINLIERKVDVAVRIGELESSSLKAKRIGCTTRGIYVSPDYIKQYGIPESVQDLDKHICLGFTKPAKLNTWPISGVNNELVVIKPSIIADSGETLRQLALQGSGIACLSSFTVKKDVDDGRLVRIFSDDVIDIPVPVSLVYHSDKAVSGRIRCFIDYVAKHINLDGSPQM